MHISITSKCKSISMRAAELQRCAFYIAHSGRQSLVRKPSANTARSYRIGTLRVVENLVARVSAGHSTGPGWGLLSLRGSGEGNDATHRTAPQCTASASALQPCSIRCSRARARCAYIRNHANVMRMRCSCGP